LALVKSNFTTVGHLEKVRFGIPGKIGNCPGKIFFDAHGQIRIIYSSTLSGNSSNIFNLHDHLSHYWY